MKKKAILVANHAFTLSNFRAEFIESLKAKGYEVKALIPEGQSIDNAEYINFPLSRRGLNPISDLKTLFSLIKIFIKEKPDVVYNYTIKPVIYSSIAAGLVGVKQIFSNITGLGFIFTGESLLKKVMKVVVGLQYDLALSMNTKVFFQNKDDLNTFVTAGFVDKSKTKIINGSGINLEKFQEVNSDYDKDSFLLIARLLKDKGIGEYIDAAREVKKLYPQAQFRLIGDFDDNPASYQKADVDQWMDEGVVEYLGHQKDVRSFISKTAVFVLPSYREGTPRAVLESMAMSKAVITTDVPGCRETVKNGVTGYLVLDRDVESLKAAMIHFIENPHLVETMGKEGRLYAQEKYDVNFVNQEILDELK